MALLSAACLLHAAAVLLRTLPGGLAAPFHNHDGPGYWPGEATVEGVQGISSFTVLEEFDQATALHSSSSSSSAEWIMMYTSTSYSSVQGSFRSNGLRYCTNSLLGECDSARPAGVYARR
jgi:hypothetical protein